MRIILLLLFTFSIQAATIEERLKALPDLRSAMYKCGHRYSKQHIKRIIKNNNIAKVVCLESKTTEVNDEETARLNRLTNKKAARVWLQSQDCSALAGLNKRFCYILQR